MVSALTVIGAAIRSFDAHWMPTTACNDIDKGSFEAAKRLFPNTPDIRLFDHIDIVAHAASCWRRGPEAGLRVLENLHFATGWWSEYEPAQPK